MSTPRLADSAKRKQLGAAEERTSRDPESHPVTALVRESAALPACIAAAPGRARAVGLCCRGAHSRAPGGHIVPVARRSPLFTATLAQHLVSSAARRLQPTPSCVKSHESCIPNTSDETPIHRLIAESHARTRPLSASGPVGASSSTGSSCPRLCTHSCDAHAFDPVSDSRSVAWSARSAPRSVR